MGRKPLPAVCSFITFRRKLNDSGGLLVPYKGFCLSKFLGGRSPSELQGCLRSLELLRDPIKCN